MNNLPIPPKCSSRTLITTLLLALGVSGLFSNAAHAGPKVFFHTSAGDFVIELNEEKAPKTVANFLKYVDEGFYNKTIFHRVIKGFMVQGGGYTQDFDKKDTHDPIPNEADNGLKNLRGTIAMARTSRPHSATAQFFINHQDNASLNHRGKAWGGWGYAVFGKVIKGMDVIDKIANIKTGASGPLPSDVPQTQVMIRYVQANK